MKTDKHIMDNRGCISILENGDGRWIVEVKLVNGDLWLAKHQMADLLGVYENTIGNNLRVIFKSGLLHEHKVTRTVSWERKGKQYFSTLYNLEALIFVSYRIGSFQARAFREWVKKALCGHIHSDKRTMAEVMVVYNVNLQNQDIY